MASELVQTWTEQTFADATRQGVVVIDFWAPWCQPCRMQAPAFDAAAATLAGKAVFGKVNIDESAGVATKFGVRSIPTLLVLKDGKVVATKVGLTRQEELTALVQAQLA